MSWIDDTLREFGQQMGLVDLSFGAHGVAQLVFDDGAVLVIEPVQRGESDEVLVYLSRPMGFDAPQRRRLALAKAHFKGTDALVVQVASQGQGPEASLMALTRMPARAFTLQSLDHAFDYLNRWHNSLGN